MRKPPIPPHQKGRLREAEGLFFDFSQILCSISTEVAEIIRSSTASVNSQRADTSLKYLESYRRENGLGALKQLHVAHPKLGFLLTNLSRMPIATLDFGWGVPTAVLPLTQGPRVMAIMSDDQDYVVRVSLGT